MGDPLILVVRFQIECGRTRPIRRPVVHFQIECGDRFFLVVNSESPDKN